MSILRRVTVAAATSMLVFGVLIPGAGAATSPAATHPTPPQTRWAVNHSPARTVRSYWNPRRLAEAKPAPLPARPGTAKISSSRDGEPRMVHASRPTGAAGGLQPNASEWVTVGRLFFHNPANGGDYVCTANVVTSNNHDVIATARHCVMDISTGAWYTNFQFAPSYNKGSAPYGWWTWRSAGVRTDDTSPGGDNAFIVLNSGGNGGARVQDAVGGSGIGFNWSTNNYAHAIGIPAGVDYAVWCEGAPVDSYNGGVHIPNCQGLSGGASGGPFIVNYQSDGSAVQTATFFGSWGSGTDGNSYFAYYRDAAWNVYNGAQNA
ncbi:peptidase [Actinoallomurus oryzae]|uniref:Peptidase n=1 Tax=Actinoallomurus oryzae TaxID=502180 RepID=A0ABP8QL16_9ACTN